MPKTLLKRTQIIFKPYLNARGVPANKIPEEPAGSQYIDGVRQPVELRTNLEKAGNEIVESRRFESTTPSHRLQTDIQEQLIKNARATPYSKLQQAVDEHCDEHWGCHLVLSLYGPHEEEEGNNSKLSLT